MPESENYIININSSISQEHKWSKQSINQQKPSYKKSSSKIKKSLNKQNDGHELQYLIDAQSVNQGQLSNLGLQKKRLFEISFFSKDHTQDQSNDQGFIEVMKKIHFERQRSRDLNQSLILLKQKYTQQYLSDLMKQFNELSQQNFSLRQVYKKQVGKGFRPNAKKTPSLKNQETLKNNENQFQTENHTPRNLKQLLYNVRTGRRSIASVCGSEQIKYNTSKPSGRQGGFMGIGTQNFCQPKKLQMFRQSSKMVYCQSSIDIHNGQSLVPSPKKHKRRESQLTERKDYPQANVNIGDNCFMMFDDNIDMSFDCQNTGRMSQPGKMPKNKQNWNDSKIVEPQTNMWKQNKNGDNLYDSLQRNSQRMRVQTYQSQAIPQSSNNKNIFIQFLQGLLIDQQISYNQLTEEVNNQVEEDSSSISHHSYQNVKFIEQLQNQIMTKNIKLKQLQEVVNVFKTQIEQIMGTDIKMINEVMLNLLEVKGKYLEMQDKVNGLTSLKKQLKTKEKMKNDILNTIMLKAQKQKNQNSQQQNSNNKNVEQFLIPQSIKTLFQMLNIKMKPDAKPNDYVNEIKQLPKNKQLFQAIDSKKRGAYGIKIKQTIDCIRQGRKKFNQVIKIYEQRILKLQQKIRKFKISIKV